MTKIRKSMQVSEIVKMLNSTLLKSDFIDKELDRTEGKTYREGVCMALEQILFATGQYKGYRFIDKKEAVKPYAFGCDYSKLTDKVEEQKAAFEDSDSTRRQYFL